MNQLRDYSIKNLLRWGRNLIRFCLGCAKIFNSINGNFIKIKVPGYRNVFCGYYDRSPFRPNNPNQILIHANNENPLINPKPTSKTDLFLYDWESRKILKNLGSTQAWNWQQGARLMWLDKDNIIFNFFDGESYRSKRINIETSKEDIFDYPVQDGVKNLVISLDYEILAKYRPDYGYFVHSNFENTLPKLTKLDLSVGESEIIVSWKDISKFLNLEIPPYGSRFNHVCLSPFGGSFVFLYRFESKEGTKHFLFYKNLETKKISLLIKDAIISHYCWEGSRHLIFWGVIGDAEGYFKIDVFDLTVSNILIKVKDGHPNYLGDGVFITDTYPDKSQFRHLYKFSLDGKVEKVTKFIEFPSINVTARCDLHPSLSSDQKYLEVDIQEGFSKTCVILKII